MEKEVMWRIILMKRYDQIVINSLLDNYEKSKLRLGQNKVSITIKTRIEDIIPKYHQPDLFSDEYELLHEQLKELETKELVSLKWKKNKIDTIIDYVSLNVEKINDAYHFVNRRDLTDKEHDLLSLCYENLNVSDISNSFLNHLIYLLTEHNSFKKYVDINDLDKFKKELVLLEKITNNKEELYVRELSIKFFNDSKTAEPLLNKVCSLIREFSDNDFSSYTNEELLEEFNIYHNPSWIMIKGKNYLQYPKINIDNLSNGISFSSKDINLLKWDKLKHPSIILTVENLTSFTRIDTKDKNVIVLYLAGFANHVKCDFLKKLYSYYSNSNYYHFGDIDCGGFKIWKNLVNRTDISFKPIYMDLNTIKTNINYSKPLTKNDIDTLSLMKNDPFFINQASLFDYMLDNNIKLEQECINLNIDSLI